MEHLSAETLARLVDEAPSPDERLHLETCPVCTGEVEAYREQSIALGALPDLRPPPGDWAVLEARLVSEGLVRSGSRFGTGLAYTPGWMRAAAAVLLFVGGAVSGGLAIRGPMVANFTGDLPSGATLPAVAQASTPEEAAELMRVAERRYVDAVLQWKQLTGMEGGAAAADPADRFAALEYVVQHAQVALRSAPADPFLNGLVASAVDERDAVLRQISTPDDRNWY